jgi:hypothetical protein
MVRPFVLLSLAVGVGVAVTSCAPTDPSAPEMIAAPATKPPPPELPTHLRDRIDQALKYIRKRDLLASHSFWTVFHGILGVGPESAMLFKDGKRVKALEYICNGGQLRGLRFEEHGPDRFDVVTMAGSMTGQGHQDQFIAEMTQWGMPRDKKIKLPLVGEDKETFKEITFDAFVQYSRERALVTANQELSWAIIIIAEFFPHGDSWTNLKGEKLTLEDVVDYELTQPIKDCPVCGGTHRLFGLTWAYHRHMEKTKNKDGKKDVWRRVAAATREYADLAKKLQNKDGSFSTNYLRGPGNRRDDLTLRIHSTGHVFEWLALALSDEELRSRWMENAANALAVMILEHRDQGLDGGALYHGTHGLEIYRNRVFGPTAHPPVIPPYPR